LFSQKALTDVNFDEGLDHLLHVSLGHCSCNLDKDSEEGQNGSSDVHHNFAAGRVLLLSSDLCAKSRSIGSPKVLFEVLNNVSHCVVDLLLRHSVEVSHVLVMLSREFADLVPVALNLGLVHSLNEIVVSNFLVDPFVDSLGVKEELVGHWLSCDFIDGMMELILNISGDVVFRSAFEVELRLG